MPSTPGWERRRRRSAKVKRRIFVVICVCRDWPPCVDWKPACIHYWLFGSMKVCVFVEYWYVWWLCVVGSGLEFFYVVVHELLIPAAWSIARSCLWCIKVCVDVKAILWMHCAMCFHWLFVYLMQVCCWKWFGILLCFCARDFNTVS